MELFVLGDVHGCFHTFRKLIEDHWDRDKQKLVQLGDLMDRGNLSPETILYAIELQKNNHDKVIFLKGNHEFEAIEYFHKGNENWYKQCGQKTIKQFERSSLELINYLSWMESLPIFLYSTARKNASN